MLKPALAGVMMLALNPGPTAVYVTHPYVKQVICDIGRGTAFQVAPGVFLSVNHVTSLGNCKIDGKPMTVIYEDGWEDFAIATIPDATRGGIKISCDGFTDGQAYWALGYAEGKPIIRAVMIRADGTRTKLFGGGRFIAFSGNGTVIPGMSGGIVQNGKGEAVGMVNAYNPFTVTSFSRPLKNTPVCRG